MLFPPRAPSVALWLGVAASGFVACTFPDFVVLPSASAGTTGDGGHMLGGGRAGASSGGGGASGSASGSGGSVAEGGRADPGPSGGNASDAGAGGATDPLPVCVLSMPFQHCTDGIVDADETDVDCGGHDCSSCAAEEACLEATDCSSGACRDGRCRATLSLSYAQQKPDDETATVLMRVVVKNDGDEPVPLRDVSIRYYFSRNMVAEPVLPRQDCLAVHNPSGANLAQELNVTVVRLPRGDGIDVDAYLNVAFTTSGRLLDPGDLLDMRLGLMLGGGDQLFSQKTHYSFEPNSELHTSKKLPVFVEDTRVWGRPPRLSQGGSCPHLGVNLAGEPITIDTQPWLGSPAAPFDPYSDATLEMAPPAAKSRELMLRNGFHLQDSQFSYPVQNGQYLVIAYAWSPDTTSKGQLQLQGAPYDVFYSQTYDHAAAWAPLGPYLVTVSNGQLDIGVDGAMNLSGFELRIPESR